MTNRRATHRRRADRPVPVVPGEQLDKIGGTEPTIVIAARLPQRTHHHNTKGTT